MRTFISLTALLLLSHLSAQQSEALNTIFEDIRVIEKQFKKGNPLRRGQHPATFPVRPIDETIDETNAIRGKLQELQNLSNSSLAPNDIINKEIRILQLSDQLSWVDFKMYLITFNAEGGAYNSPVFFLPRLPFNTVKDYEAYLKWLPSFVAVLENDQDLITTGIKEGIQAPKVIVANNLKLLQPWITDVVSHPFYRPIANMPSSLSESEKESISKRATAIIEKKILPAYRSYHQFLEKEYMVSAPNDVGISAIKNGDKYYENRVKHYTTLDMSPDSVFNLGMTEVARIKTLMQEVITSLNYKGSFANFLEFLRTDPQFYAKSPQELLSRAAWLSKKAEGELPKLLPNSTSYPLRWHLSLKILPLPILEAVMSLGIVIRIRQVLIG